MAQKIIYIEDNADNTEIVRQILQNAGYDTYLASEGREGIDLILEHQPDLIICDFHLPELSGAELVQLIRANELIKYTPIIMLTADLYTRPQSIEAGVNIFLTKPIRRRQLLSSIEKLLASGEQFSN